MSTTASPKFIYIPTQVETDETGAFVDIGRWREKGVTHWHCVYEEWGTDRASLEARYNNDRWKAATMRPTTVTFSPQETLDWLDKQYRDAVAAAPDPDFVRRRRLLLTEDDWRSLAEISFHSLMHGSCSGGGLLITPARSVVAMAYPMTDQECARCTG